MFRMTTTAHYVLQDVKQGNRGSTPKKTLLRQSRLFTKAQIHEKMKVT